MTDRMRRIVAERLPGLVLAVLLCAAPRAQAAGPAGMDSLTAAPATPATEPATLETPAPAPAATMANQPLSAVHMARLTGKPKTVVRTGPSEGDAIAGVYPAGTSFPVLSRSGDWVNVRLSPTASGWVHVSLCAEYDDLSNIKMQPNPRLYVRTGAYVLEGYAGGYSFDRKSNSLALGGRLAYYVFDRVQVETGALWTHVHRPAEIVESLFGLSLEAEDFHMLSYHLNGTYEFLPGRQMVPFVTAGVGSSILQGRAETAFNFGAGTTLFLSKRTGMRWEVRDYAMHSGTERARRLHHNIEFSLGSLLLF